MSVAVQTHDPRNVIPESPSLTPEQRRRLRELVEAISRERRYNADKNKNSS